VGGSARSNPFGSTRAVDTALRFTAIELKEKEREEERIPEKRERATEAETTMAAEAAAASEDDEVEEGWDGNTLKPEDAGLVTPKEDEDADRAADDVGDEELRRRDGGGEKKKRGERRYIEPKVVNSRAAIT
jgi:hypothetical protein